MRVAVAVKVLYFARLREKAGMESERIELPSGATVRDVFAAAARAHPALDADREVVRAAVNREFEDWSATVADGDEVAFIPPVSGGDGREI